MHTIRFFLQLIGLLYSCASCADSRLLMPNMADPDAIILGDYFYLVGTSDAEAITIFRATIKSVKTALKHKKPLSTLFKQYKTYTPRHSVINLFGESHAHRYCEIWAPDLALVKGEIWLTFSAQFHPLTHLSCQHIVQQAKEMAPSKAIFIAKNFGPPLFLNLPHFGLYSSFLPMTAFTHKVMRIDSNVFVDQQQHIWLSYTWFTGKGSANSSINLNTGKKVHHTLPNYRYDEGITEAPSFFYRQGFYYLVYSENYYHSKYQLYYKKAKSINKIKLKTPSCRLSFNSWHTSPSNNHYGYNAGHGTVINLDNEFYLVHHIGKGYKQNLTRDTYISKLKFYTNGNIQQIKPPDFIQKKNLLRNLPHCY